MFRVSGHCVLSCFSSLDSPASLYLGNVKIAVAYYKGLCAIQRSGTRWLAVLEQYLAWEVTIEPVGLLSGASLNCPVHCVMESTEDWSCVSRSSLVSGR
jgi:hypothetical protein